jgi:hypothetical protein
MKVNWHFLVSGPPRLHDTIRMPIFISKVVSQRAQLMGCMKLLSSVKYDNVPTLAGKRRTVIPSKCEFSSNVLTV